MVQEGGRPASAGLIAIALSCGGRDPSPGAARPSPGPGRLRRAWGQTWGCGGGGVGASTSIHPGMETAVA